jgi:hypothetical protein
MFSGMRGAGIGKTNPTSIPILTLFMKRYIVVSVLSHLKNVIFQESDLKFSICVSFFYCFLQTILGFIGSYQLGYIWWDSYQELKQS